MAIALLVPFYGVWSIFEDLVAVAVATAAATAAFALAVVSLTRGADRLRDGMQSYVGAIDRRLILAILIMFGCAVRIAYFAFVPDWPRISDETDYLQLAERLIETGSYSFPGEGSEVAYRAHRAPGYPFLLVPVVWLLGTSYIAPLVFHLLLFVSTCLVTYALGRDAFDPFVGVAAAGFVAAWPSLAFLTGQALSEPATILLFTFGAWACVRLLSARRWLIWSVLLGLACGYATLVRPSLLLLPAVWIAVVLVSDKRRLAVAGRIAVAVLAMVLTIMPWTVRNYLVLGDLVVVSTNAGSVLYRANNPLAYGGFSARGERDLRDYAAGEVEIDRLGRRWALEWIRENPLQFLVLALHKQRIFLGTDQAGAHYTYTRFVGEDTIGANYDRTVAFMLHAVQQIWWIAMWILAAASLLKFRLQWWNSSRDTLLILMCLYLIPIHSVFESQPRYHFPFVCVLCVVAASVFRSTTVPAATRAQESALAPTAT